MALPDTDRELACTRLSFTQRRSVARRAWHEYSPLAKCMYIVSRTNIGKDLLISGNVYITIIFSMFAVSANEALENGVVITLLLDCVDDCHLAISQTNVHASRNRFKPSVWRSSRAMRT